MTTVGRRFQIESVANPNDLKGRACVELVAGYSG